MRIQLLMAISVAAWVVANAFFALFIILNDYPIAQVTAIILFRGLLGTLRQYRSGIISHRMRFARPLDTASQFRVQNASYLDFEMLGFVFINLSMPSIGSWYAAALFIASDMAGLLSNLVYFFATSGRYLRRDTQEFMDRQVFRSHSSTAAAGSTATGSGVTAIEEREQRVPLMPSRRSSTKPPLPAPPPPPPPLFSVSEKLVLGSIRTTTSSVCSSTLHPESEGGHSVSHVALSPSSNQHLTASGRMDGSELRATEQMRLSDRSPVPTTLDLCIQTFILDLLVCIPLIFGSKLRPRSLNWQCQKVRFFSIAYFFTYVVPVTQIESQLYWNPTIRFVYDNRTDKSDPAVTTLPIHRAVVYMGTTLALSFVCALIVDFLARTLTRRSLMEHAREMLGHADMYLITVGSLYLAPVFMIGGRHWGFLAYLFDLAVGSEIGHVP
ncbi:hypothetical protein BC828DRAFT_376282 [Blastocladiella britannica]|nr:hypothetical protein BC828DRAFT_376282 [Blastocladiella britannica]